MGNNDGKYHYQGIDKADKEDFYGNYYQHWFLNHPFNSQLPNIGDIKNTFMNGGYYRVDIDSQLSVLAVNSLYFNKKNDPSK